MDLRGERPRTRPAGRCGPAGGATGPRRATGARSGREIKCFSDNMALFDNMLRLTLTTSVDTLSKFYEKHSEIKFLVM